MARNYITNQCCSVQDLQSYLRCWKPTDPDSVRQGVSNIQESIDYEKDHQNRVSILKLLTSKMNALRKLSYLVLVFMLVSCVTTNSDKLAKVRIPKSLDYVQVQSYVTSGKGRMCSENTAIIKMGQDSIIYQTYWYDKAMWMILDTK